MSEVQLFDESKVQLPTVNNDLFMTFMNNLRTHNADGTERIGVELFYDIYCSASMHYMLGIAEEKVLREKYERTVINQRSFIEDIKKLLTVYETGVGSQSAEDIVKSIAQVIMNYEESKKKAPTGIILPATLKG